MNHLSSFLIRGGLSLALFYSGVNGFFEPNSWLPFVPKFLQAFSSAQSLLIFILVFQIILGLWLLSGKYILYSGLLVFFYLITIVTLNMNNLGIVFRDVSLALVSLALALSDKKK